MLGENRHILPFQFNTPPFPTHFMTVLQIKKSDFGFYNGFNKTVTIGSKILIGLLVLWAGLFPTQSGNFLSEISTWTFTSFGAWYMYASAAFMYLCLLFCLVPSIGKVKLGQPGETPEFSRFSWVAMMFGAGIGIGMLTYSTAEPLYHFSNNPDVIKGDALSQSANNVRNAFKWSFLHYGLTPWGIYAIVALSMAYASFNRGLPLTIRSTLTPLFGKKLEGSLGNIVDISAVIATILGVAVTMGFGISQFSSGIFELSQTSWLMDEKGSPTNIGMITGLVIIMFASILSALSGVGRGIKWLSNLNLGLSFALLFIFLVFGPTSVITKQLFISIWDYVTHLPEMTLIYWFATDQEPGTTLFTWQSINWTVFYWAWWIAFAPFVGLFLARISKGRTVREFVLGAMFVPSFMCFIWFSFAGGTAINLELLGQAGGAILSAGQEAQLFETIKVMLTSTGAKLVTIMIVILLMTYLITSVDSAILVINTINSGGDQSQKSSRHIIIWGVALTLVISMLLIADGLQALRSTMFVAALPFSAVMMLMAIALVKSLYRDGKQPVNN